MKIRDKIMANLMATAVTLRVIGRCIRYRSMTPMHASRLYVKAELERFRAERAKIKEIMANLQEITDRLNTTGITSNIVVQCHDDRPTLH